MKKLNFLLKFVIALIITFGISAYANAQNPFNYCLNFDGVDDYVEIPDAITLDYTINYTIEVWIKPESFSWLGGIVTKYHVGSSNGYLLRLHSAAPYSGLCFDEMYTSTGIMEVGKWYHIAAVNDNGTRRLYLNGIEQTLTGTPLTVAVNSDPVCLGVDYLADPRYFNGKIDEVRIWDKALTQQEIIDNMDVPLRGNESWLVAYYKLDEGTGITATDRRGNNDGTLHNMAEDDWVVSTVPYFWDGPGSALNFDGINESVYTDLGDLSGSEITIEYWFKGSNTQSAVRQQDANNYIVAGWHDLHILSNDGGVENGLLVGAGAEDGNWHHIAMTWKQNTADGFVSYLDGELVESRNSSNTPIPNIINNVLIGSFQGASEFITGQLDEIRIWNIARSQSEIVQTMDSFLQGNENGLISYWQLNEGTGMLTHDYAGGFQGTLVNMDETNWVSSIVPPGYNGAGTALNFNWYNDHVSFDPLWATSPDELTFEAWYKFSGDSGEGQYLIYHGDNGEFSLTKDNNSFDASVKLSDGNWYNVSTTFHYYDKWHHVACTWKKNESVKLYVNGSLRDEIVVPDFDLYDPGNGYLPSFGKINRTSNNLIGDMDEVRIWNVARTETEIREKMFGYLNGSEPGLVGNWQFNEGAGNTVYDIAGGHNGTLHGFTPSDWVQSGIPTMTTGRGNAIEMNHPHDYYTVDASYNYFNGLYFSIEAWIKPDNSNPDQIVVSKFPGNNQGFLLGIKEGQLYGQVGNNTTTFSIMGGDIPSNEWTHIAVTWNGDWVEAFNAYVNGVLVAAETVSGWVYGNTSNLVIGAASWATNQKQFFGQIDEVRLWNRARTQKQIFTNMHGILSGNEQYLVSYWQFNAGSGSFCYDFAGGYDAVTYGWKNYVSSTFPLGVSYEQNIPYTYTGTLDFPGTGFSMKINQLWSDKDLLVTRVDAAPYGPPAQSANILDSQYWKIWQNNNYQFDADYNFAVNEDITANDELYPYDIKLYNRATRNESWQLEKGALSAYATNDSLIYADVSNIGQLVLGRLNGPLATNFSPDDDETDVYIRDKLIITFNKDIFADTGNIIIKHTSDNSVFESFAANGLTIQNNMVIIDPQDNFTPLTGYYVTIDDSVFKDNEDKYFEGFSDTGSWNFSTSDHPLVENFTPVDNETCVSRLTDLLIDFDRDIFAGTGNIYIRKTADSSLFETVPASEATFVNDVATFDPVGVLDVFTEYFIQIDSNTFHDASLNDFAGIQKAGTWNFTISEFPLAENFMPADGSTGINLRSNLRITFDRNITAGDGNIVIYSKGQGITDPVVETIPAINTTINGGGLIIDPVHEFHLSNEYYVLIDTNAFHDGQGNYFAGIESSEVWNFATTGNDLFADFTGDTIYGSTPVTVNFSDISVLHNASPITEWKWYFGDGDSSSVQNPAHTYEHTSSVMEAYTVTLRVKDANDSVSVMIKDDYVKVCPQNYIPGGNVSGVWTVANSPYFIGGEIIVPYGDTLTLEPGVSLKFRTNTEDFRYLQELPTPSNTDFGYMTVYGTLIAQGTEIDSVVFTRQGNNGLWGMIHITKNANPENPIEYCKIDYASYFLIDTLNNKVAGGLSFDGIETIVQNSNFSNNFVGVICDSSNSIITYNTFSNNGNGIICFAESAPQISNNIFSGGGNSSGTNAIIVTGEGCEPIINNNMIGNYNHGIYLLYADSCTIVNNTINNCETGIEIDDCATLINGNNISGNDLGIYCDGGSNIMISNDTISGNGTGIKLWFSSPSIINNLIHANTEYGMHCQYNSGFISGNTISDNGTEGIYLRYSYSTVAGNHILNNGHNGIYCERSDLLIITKNTISGNQKNGIHCYKEYNEAQLKIDHNHISSNQQNGICCDLYSDLQIDRNVIFLNNQNGIYCTDHSNMELINNTIADNNYGVSCDGSSAIDIANSILWNNTLGVVAPGSAVTITWSCVQGGYAGDGNIDVDPMFTGAKNGEYNLTWTNFPDKSDSTKISPCIDTGNPDLNGNGSDWMVDPDDRGPDMSRFDMGGLYHHQIPLVTVYNDPDTTSGEYKFFNFGEWQIPEISFPPKTFYIRNDADRFNDCPVFFEGAGGSQFNLINQEDTLLYLGPYELDSVDVVFQPTNVGSQHGYLTASDTAQYTDSLWVRGTGLGTGTVIGYVNTPTGEGVPGVTITVGPYPIPPTDGGEETGKQGKGGNNRGGSREIFTTLTMPDGSYAITNVGYGDFSVAPSLTQYDIVHDFNPEISNVTLTSSTPFSTSFTDVSYFIVSGNVSYLNTTCPSAGIHILMDDVPAAITDEFGGYTIEDVQIGSHTFKPDIAGGHYFTPTFIFDTIMYPVAGLNFKDEFTYKLSGYVTGGCGIPLADSVGLIVECLNVCGITDTIYTDSLGFYSINLPPYQYYITPATLNYFGALITFGTEQVDVSENDTIQDFIYHSDPIIEIYGFDSVTNQNGWIILEQFKAYQIEIDVFEPYGEFGEIMCRVDTGTIIILDDLSDVGQVDIPISDTTLYSFYAGLPNIAGGGEHAYQKRIQFQYVYDTKSVVTNEEWVYITGQCPRETAFTTTTPEIPLLILRDPPGDNSYSYMSEITEVSQAISFGMEYMDHVGYYTKTSLGLKFQSSVGFGFAITTNVNVTMDFTTGMDMTMTQNSITENQMKFVTSETFSTSGDEYIVGQKADLYMGGAMNLLYGITDVLSIEDTVITVDQDIIIVPDGFATTYIYSEYYIENTVIPALCLIGDTISAQRWESFINLNQYLKNEAIFYQNISFDAGVSYSYFEMMSQSSTQTQKFDLTITEEVALNAGLQVNGIGATGGVKISTTLTTGSSQVNSTVNSTKIGFDLGDNDPGDAFTVDVKTDPVYGTPVFVTLSGQTKCPYEENTVPRQGCELNPHTFVANDVPPGEPAVFYLYMNNTSQTDEDWIYQLGVLNETNPHGATVKAGGKTLASPIQETLLANTMTPITIYIYRPPGEIYDIVGLALRLDSPCEASIAAALGVEPNLADYATFDVHFTPPCSPVSIMAPDNNWVINQANNNVLQVTITDYDVTNSQLQTVSLEYSPDFGSNWIEAYSIPKDSIQTSFLVIDWDVTYLMDDYYLLRSVAECEGGAENYSEMLTGLIDRSSPQVSGNPEPTDGILNIGDEISFSFNEDLDPSSVTINTCQLLNAENGMQVGASVQYNQAFNKIIYTVNAGLNYFIENRYLESQVFGVTDRYGNPIADTANWTFFVDQGPLHWNPNSFSFNINAGDTINFNSVLDNSSSQEVYYSVLVPYWLLATPYSGYLSGAGGSVDVDFTSGLMQGGVYYDTIYSSTLGYPEEEIYIMVQATGGPELEVSPANRDVSASAGNTSFDVTSNTEWEVSESEDWLNVDPINGDGDGTLTVNYDENISGSIRVGEITVTADGGSPVVIVTVTQESYLVHTINLPEGWTGLSSYLMPADTDIENIFSDIQGELIIALTEEGIYYPGLNINTIGNWSQHSAYKIKTNSGVSVNIIGTMEENKTLQLVEGWNLIPVISTCPVDVEALFAPLVTDLVIVKDVAGYGIYWPEMGINTLGTLNPGEAYYVLVSNPVSVNFGECTKTTYPEENLTGFQNLLGLVPWQLTHPTPSSHTIAIMPEAIKGFEQGSIIGAFNHTGKCFGITQISKNLPGFTGHKTGQNLEAPIAIGVNPIGYLAVFGDDPFSTEKDGFEAGETIAFRLFNPTTNEQVDLTPGFDPTFPNVSGTFAENGISAITGFKISGTGISINITDHIFIYPNPSTGIFLIKGIDENAMVEILDVRGQLIRGRIKISDNGKEINLTGKQPGIYMLKIFTEGQFIYKKVVLQ